MDALINETYFLNPNTTEEDIEMLETANYTIGLETYSGAVRKIKIKIFFFSKIFYFYFLGITWIYGQNVQWKHPDAYTF